MTKFILHTEETAPEASKPLLADSKKSYGVIPGLHEVMADAFAKFTWDRADRAAA